MHVIIIAKSLSHAKDKSVIKLGDITPFSALHALNISHVATFTCTPESKNQEIVTEMSINTYTYLFDS